MCSLTSNFTVHLFERNAGFSNFAKTGVMSFVSLLYNQQRPHSVWDTRRHHSLGDEPTTSGLVCPLVVPRVTAVLTGSRWLALLQLFWLEKDDPARPNGSPCRESIEF